MERRHKMEKHPNGQYRVRITRNAVQKSFFLGKNKKKAEKRLKQIESDIANGKICFAEQQTTRKENGDGKKDMRIEELAYEHLKWVEQNRSEGTFTQRKHYVLKFLKFIGEAMVSEITRIKLEDFHAEEKQKGKKPNSGNESLRHVKTMLLWGEEMELIDLPFKKFPKVRYVPPKTKRVSPHDLGALLAHLPDDLKDMVKFALLTGLRPNELRELTQEQIQYSPDGLPYVIIEAHKTARTKGETKPRTIPLSEKAEEIVNRQIKKHPKTEIVFLNAEEKPYTRSVFRNRLVRWSRRAGIKDVTPYALRHTFASMESDSRVETTSLAGLMGHSQVRTLQRYVSNTFDSHKKAVDEMGKQLDKIVSQSESEKGE